MKRLEHNLKSIASAPTLQGKELGPQQLPGKPTWKGQMPLRAVELFCTWERKGKASEQVHRVP